MARCLICDAGCALAKDPAATLAVVMLTASTLGTNALKETLCSSHRVAWALLMRGGGLLDEVAAEHPQMGAPS